MPLPGESFPAYARRIVRDLAPDAGPEVLAEFDALVDRHVPRPGIRTILDNVPACVAALPPGPDQVLDAIRLMSAAQLRELSSLLDEAARSDFLILPGREARLFP